MKRICVPQTRYRWNFRPTASNGWPKPGPLPQRPLGGGYRPYIPAPQPPPNTLPPITAATSTVQPTTTVTIRPTTMEIMTLSPDIMPTEAGKNPITCNFIVQPMEAVLRNTFVTLVPPTTLPLAVRRQPPSTKPDRRQFGERCHLPKTNGEGEDLIPRWYFDTTIRKCKRFLYKGLKGNANNFVTSIQCMETCETADRAATLKNPCASDLR
uniref:BPTI/Kunitz inhibitor domain-containing protein n=1 Tax=Ditylenchus dipsaci TaxID=166011 RepID=A0A915CQ93_9BILA